MLLVFLNHLVISCSLTHCVYGSDAKLYWKVDWENTEELQTQFVSICLKKWGGGGFCNLPLHTPFVWFHL